MIDRERRIREALQRAGALLLITHATLDAVPSDRRISAVVRLLEQAHALLRARNVERALEPNAPIAGWRRQ